MGKNIHVVGTDSSGVTSSAGQEEEGGPRQEGPESVASFWTKQCHMCLRSGASGHFRAHPHRGNTGSKAEAQSAEQPGQRAGMHLPGCQRCILSMQNNKAVSVQPWVPATALTPRTLT